jgi:hypothetical protein
MQRKYILRALGSRYWEIYVAFGGGGDEGTSCLNLRLLQTLVQKNEKYRGGMGTHLRTVCLFKTGKKTQFSTKSNLVTLCLKLSVLRSQ